MPPFRRIRCELRSVTARTQPICLNPHHRQCWTNVVTQHTQNICITFIRWPNVSDVVPALYKWYRSTNILCLLGRHFATSSWEFTGLCRYVTGIFLFSLKSVACWWLNHLCATSQNKVMRIWSLVVFIHWIIYKIIPKIMEFNPNGAVIDFYQARVWNIVNKHINFVFSAVWLVLLIFQVFGDNLVSLSM